MPEIFSHRIGIAYTSFGNNLVFTPSLPGLYLSRLQLQHQVRKSVRPTLGGGNVILIAGDAPGQAEMQYFACPPCGQIVNLMSSLYGYYLLNRSSNNFLGNFSISGINAVASLDALTISYQDPEFNVQHGSLHFTLYI